MDPMQQRVACDHCGAHRDAAGPRRTCGVCGYYGATPVPPSPGDARRIDRPPEGLKPR